IADLFKTAGADRVMTVDLHTAQIQGFFDGPVDHLQAQAVLAQHIRNTYGTQEVTVVSPDSGRVRLAEKWAHELGNRPIAFIHKTRDPDTPNQAVANRVVGKVKGQLCVLIDDMIDTGGTIVQATDALLEAGASGVVIGSTHGVRSEEHTSELQSRFDLVCRLLLEKKKL